MVDGFCYYVTLFSKIGPVVNRIAAVAARESAAMQPDHHGTLVVAAQTIRPDIQAQAILAHARGGDGRAHFRNLCMRADLRSFRTPLDGVLDASPRLWLHGRQESPIACSVRAVG